MSLLLISSEMFKLARRPAQAAATRGQPGSDAAGELRLTAC